MKNQTTTKLLDLNKQFYANISDDFDSTRNYIWKGWSRVGEYILDKATHLNRDISVLDLACGNGRFLSSLMDLQGLHFTYTGVEQDPDLLTKAKERYPKANFVCEDVVSNIGSIHASYDVVVAFGITHHIPSKELRDQWFLNISKLVKPQGLLAISFWNFDPAKKVKTMPTGIETTELDFNDYILGWDNKQDTYRYCHLYSESELEIITNIFNQNGIQLIHRYCDDGKTKNGNTYLIFARI